MKIKKMIDVELLKEILSIQSSSTEDTEINNFIIDYLSKIDEVKVEKDPFGNIYATKGNGKSGYKCIVSHTDTVHKIHKNRMVMESNGYLYAMAIVEGYYGNESIEQVGVGGDDKCGVYTCIEAIRSFNDIKAVFFRFEESGCRGSNACNMDFFSDCNFVVQCDRRNSSDFITFTNGIQVASNSFEDAMRPIFSNRNYKCTTGLITDIGTLKRRGLSVSAVNLSSGYINPHSDKETIRISDIDNCYGLVVDMFNKHGDTRFEHNYEPPKVTYPTRTYTTGMFSNSLNSNILMPKVGDMVDIEYNGFTKFIQIGTSGLYKLIDDDLFYLDGIICPSCHSVGTMLFSSYESEIYCTDSECSSESKFGEMYQYVEISDNGVKFVYDRLNDVWIVKSNAKWNKKSKNYSKK